MSAKTGLARKIVPPRGGRIYIVTVPVNEARLWKQAVRAVGKDTAADSHIWRVGKHYARTVRVTFARREVILANFGSQSVTSGETALAWGMAKRLRPASPRTIFAVGEHCHDLLQRLAVDAMAVVSLECCSRYDDLCVPLVVWNGWGRGAFLHVFDLVGAGDCWFAFVRE